LDVQFEAPQWSGQNQHSARLKAATKLREGIGEHAARGIPQVLIGHSHGGNACVLACRDLDGSLAGAVSGVACLSTPFLVVRHQPHAGSFAIASMVAWWVGASVAAFFLTNDSLVAAAIIFPIVIATMGLLF
jgi:alpha-beta hydrolase superfamily lysophospholipase